MNVRLLGLLGVKQLLNSCFWTDRCSVSLTSGPQAQSGPSSWEVEAILLVSPVVFMSTSP